MSQKFKYIFSKSKSDIGLLFNNSIVDNSIHVKEFTNFENAALYCKTCSYNFIYGIIKNTNNFVYKIEVQNDEETTHHKIVDNVSFEHVGFSIDVDSSVSKLALYTKAEIEKYKEVMIVYNGQMLSRDLIPAHLKYLISDKAHIPTNPVPATAHMHSDIGKMVVSSCNVMGLPQHIFFPMIEKMDDIHFKEQWLSSSSDLKQEQFVGYMFNSDTYMLNSVKMIPRLGTHDKPGKKSPAPKICIIEGLIPDTNEWEAITEEIEFDNSMWSFLTPIELDLSEETTKFYQGFRIKILEWFPGAEKNMLTGLMRLEFLCTVPHAIKTPSYVTPDLKNLTYAQFNPVLIDTAPKPSYINPTIVEPIKPEPVKESEITVANVNITDYISCKHTHNNTFISDSIISFISITDSNPVTFTKDSNLFYQKDTIAYVNMTDSPVIFETEDPCRFILLQYDKKRTSSLSIGSGDMLIIRKVSDELFVVCVDNSVE